MKILDEDLGLMDFIKTMERDHLSKVEVGILQKDGNTPHAQTLKDTGKKVTMANIAAWNEFGAGVPQRPFLSSTIDSSKVINEMEQRFINGVIGGKSIKSGLHSAGKFLKSSIRDAIKNWATPPNSPSWIEEKGKNDPLVWTGQLMNTIDYEYKQGKSKRKIL